MNRTDAVTVLPDHVAVRVNPGRHRARGAGKRYIDCFEPARKRRANKRQANYKTEHPQYMRYPYADHWDLLYFSVDSVRFENTVGTVVQSSICRQSGKNRRITDF